MPNITNDIELLTLISGIASNVINEVSMDMLTVLYKDIMEYTYDGLPNVYYYNNTGVPTFQFRDAFQLTDIQNNLKTVVTELYYNWMSMEFEPETYLHGSPWSGDMRQKLAEILNVEGSTGFSNKVRQPYWDIFIKEMFDEGGLDKLFAKYMKEEFGKHGMRVIRI